MNPHEIKTLRNFKYCVISHKVLRIWEKIYYDIEYSSILAWRSYNTNSMPVSMKMMFHTAGCTYKYYIYSCLQSYLMPKLFSLLRRAYIYIYTYICVCSNFVCAGSITHKHYKLCAKSARLYTIQKYSRLHYTYTLKKCYPTIYIYIKKIDIVFLIKLG